MVPVIFIYMDKDTYDTYKIGIVSGACAEILW